MKNFTPPAPPRRVDPATDPAEPHPSQWMTTDEVARYLRKSPNAVRIMVNRGYLKVRKFRSRLYFRRIDLELLLESSL